MRRRPLALPCCVILLSLLTIRGVCSQPEVYGVAVAVMNLIGGVAIWRGARTVCLITSCIAIAVCASSMAVPQLVVGAAAASVDIPVRIQGHVQRIVRLTSTSCSYIVEGHTDACALPCIRLRTVCTEPIRAEQPVPGEERIIFGRMRLPAAPQLPDEIDERSIAHQWNVSLIVRASSAHTVNGPPYLSSLRNQIHRSVSALTAQCLPPDISGVVCALMLGDRTGIPSARMALYQRTGTAHMFSVSGSHVGLVLIVVLLFLSRWRGTGMVITASLLIAGYVFLTGSESPAVRAACMGISALIARRCEWDFDGINVLCGSMILLAVADPWGIDSASTVLSASAVLGMLVLVPRWRHYASMITGPVTKWVDLIMQAVSVSVAASTAVALPSLLLFGTVSITTVPANVLVVPLLSVVFLLSPLLVLCSAVGLADPIAWVTAALVRMGDHLLTAFDVAERSLQRSDIAVALGVLSIAIWWWPLAARLPTGAAIRWAAALVVMLGLRVIPEPNRVQLWTYQSRNGEAIGATTKHRSVMYVIGEGIHRPDSRLVSWTRTRREPIIVGGRGRWGKRVAARIAREVVGSKHDDSTCVPGH